ncbi:histidine phosphatase family protein [Lysobacter auxotrophicus]|uniref:Histidine phosphatase family protein n=1 Tax=Lysobacter auxotrophicus TaxID=2992573 RepID=A0ABM8DBP2_9GAMM|nr:histidine phosphatase family protein [Lysobacter auxotrophicus]BDU15989.1 histidine phosphatase family protein [Lysobacter auxotrophicus]
MTRLLLVRHASTDANGVRLAGRTAGIALNEEGRAQARWLAARLARLPVAAVYSSPLQRAMETARSIATLVGCDVEPREEFLEIEFGRWTGLDFAELSRDVRFDRFNRFRSCADVPGGENMLQAQARMVAGLSRVRDGHPHECVVVVSHGDLIRAAIAYYAGIALDMFQRIEIATGSVSEIELGDDHVRIVRINETDARV